MSELADEGEQGPKYYAKTSNLNVQPPQKNYGGSFVRGPVRYSPDVPLKLNMDMAKVWRKKIFYSAKMSFSAWKNLEQPSHTYIYSSIPKFYWILRLFLSHLTTQLWPLNVSRGQVCGVEDWSGHGVVVLVVVVLWLEKVAENWGSQRKRCAEFGRHPTGFVASMLRHVTLPSLVIK